MEVKLGGGSHELSFIGLSEVALRVPSTSELEEEDLLIMLTTKEAETLRLGVEIDDIIIKEEMNIALGILTILT